MRQCGSPINQSREVSRSRTESSERRQQQVPHFCTSSERYRSSQHSITPSRLVIKLSLKAVYILMCLCFPFYLDQLIKASRLIPPRELQIVVSDELLEDLAALRVDYARCLREYKNVLESSPEAQKKFVESLAKPLGRSLGPDHSFQSYFNILVDEKLSLFNITYLELIDYIFPADPR